MAHSFKKNPGFSDNDCCKVFQKKEANHKVRRTKDVPNGKAYRKLYNPWKICDCNCRYYSKNDLYYAIHKWDFGPAYKYWIK